MRTLRIFAILVVLIVICTMYEANGDDNVKEACKAARYHDLCIHSLAPFSNSCKRNPRKWAQAAVTVTMREAKNVTWYMNKLKNVKFPKRQKAALSDCMECFEETMENLHDSFGELTRLDAKTFDEQMGNVQTWLSSALTLEDTCLDGFDGHRRGKRVGMLRDKVTKASYVTSNALALVSALAEVGGRSLGSP